MLAGTVYAETNAATYKATVTNGEIAVEEKDLKNGIDNSNLEVNVIKQQGDTRTTIFTGKLKDYDNGAWVNTDFSEIQFMLIFDLNTMDNESVCIIPISSKSNTKSNTINETADTLSSTIPDKICDDENTYVKLKIYENSTYRHLMSETIVDSAAIDLTSLNWEG